MSKTESCQSGRMGRPRKPLWPSGHRGFESLTFRHQRRRLRGAGGVLGQIRAWSNLRLIVYGVDYVSTMAVHGWELHDSKTALRSGNCRHSRVRPGIRFVRQRNHESFRLGRYDNDEPGGHNCSGRHDSPRHIAAANLDDVFIGPNVIDHSRCRFVGHDHNYDHDQRRADSTINIDVLDNGAGVTPSSCSCLSVRKVSSSRAI